MPNISRRALLSAATAPLFAPVALAAQHSGHGSDEAEIPGFERWDFAASGRSRPVYVQGEGTAVLVLHEITGLSWLSIMLAQRLVDRGLKVYLPLLFGKVGQRNGFTGYLQSCFGSEFDCSDPNGSSRIIGWLHDLTSQIASREHGKHLAAVGMCLTGAFPLALMDVPELTRAVLSQPALPLRANSKEERESLGLSTAEIKRARDRKDARFLGLRFSNDKLCPPDRFQTLQTVLTDRFEPFVIKSGPGTEFPDDAHAVLSSWYRSTAGSPTRLAFEKVASFVAQA